jgi:hypothetical protein
MSVFDPQAWQLITVLTQTQPCTHTDTHTHMHVPFAPYMPYVLPLQ